MGIVASDWEIIRSTKNIRYVGDDHGGTSPSYATVLEFHRWLQDLADDSSSTGDDQLDISDLVPSDKKYDTIVELLGDYNIDATASEHLYDGSIIQDGGDVVYDGFVNYGNAAVQIQLIQNGAVLADDWWNYDGAGLNADASKGISHRFMLLVRTGGADIDGRIVIGTCRRFGFSYKEFKVNGTSRGNNTLALADGVDLNNQTSSGTVAGWSTIVNVTSGYKELDVNNDSTDEPYYAEWDRATYSINQFYERMKYLTRDGSSETIYGLNGELFRGITHEVPIDTNVGTFSAYEAISWSGGTGQMLAINSITAGTKLWMQLLTGDAPTDGEVITGGSSSATCAVNGSCTEREVIAPFCGNSTGSALIGAYGFALETDDLSKDDKIKDLNGTTNTPPNTVSFTVTGIVSGEDRILVAPWDGTSTDSEGNPAIDFDQMSLDTALTGSAETSAVMSAAIPTDTPATGTIRIVTNAGVNKRVAYTSYAGDTFTIESTDFSGDNADAANNVWVSYIDKLAASSSEGFSCIYLADRDFVVIVRDGGASPIKQFISSGALGSTGGSIGAIRTSDA